MPRRKRPLISPTELRAALAELARIDANAPAEPSGAELTRRRSPDAARRMLVLEMRLVLEGGLPASPETLRRWLELIRRAKGATDEGWITEAGQ